MKNFILRGLFLFMTVISLVDFSFYGSDVAAHAQGRVLRVVSPWKARGLAPEKSGFIFARMGCMEMLTTVDHSGRIVGKLAGSWSVSDNKLLWNFHLREGVRFHDCTPMTAEVVAACLNRSIEKKGVLSRTPVKQVKPLDEKTVLIVTQRPFAPLAAYLAHYSCGILSPSSFNDKGEIVNIIGTGPYRMIGSKAGKFFQFKAFTDYWGEKPQIAATSYTAVPRGETRAFMVQADQADLVFTLSPMAARKIEAGGYADIVTMTIPRTRQLLVNCGSFFFRDQRVREAISLAIDRKAIARNILRHPDSAATQLLPPAMGLWHCPNLPSLPYDVHRARTLLSEAGWKQGTEGILVKEGKHFRVVLNTYSSRPMLPSVATALQDQLKKVGIEISIVVAESSRIPEKHRDGTLQMALMARNFGLIPDAIGNLAKDFGPNPGSWGAMGWQSARMNQLIEQYWGTFDPQNAARLRKEIVAILQQELPVIPVSWYEHIVSINRKLGGIHIDPFELRSYVEGAYWVD
ncbi:MAG: ABC transporter substrate-binding protein [Deltaproteobacteria bacterium]|nr:ABC transporter substrate-binding protein [Deltaproteobacteria bacterium]MBW2154609.1 ABC transporter substrate-binding protein [Deltaproteobacteria bacterium]